MFNCHILICQVAQLFCLLIINNFFKPAAVMVKKVRSFIPNALALLTGYKDGRANNKTVIGKKLSCPSCGRKFGNEGALKVHYQIRHPEKVMFFNPVKAISDSSTELKTSPPVILPEFSKKQDAKLPPSIEEKSPLRSNIQLPMKKKLRARGIQKDKNKSSVKVVAKTFLS